MTTFEIGENRAPRYGVPVWAGEWPVLIDGAERAEIVETERGYQLRKGGVWIARQHSCRSNAEDDARNILLTWRCMNGHPAPDTRYEETEINGRTWARVTVEGTVTNGPDSNTEAVYAEFNRRYATFVEELEKDV